MTLTNKENQKNSFQIIKYEKLLNNIITEMNEDQMKQMQKEFMLKMMENFLKRAPHNVPQPMPLIEEKANNRLSQDDLISWKLMLKEWQKVSEKGKKVIARLLMLNSHDILETINSNKWFADETKDTVKYVDNHPEYGKSEEELKAQNTVEDFMKDLGLDD